MPKGNDFIMNESPTQEGNSEVGSMPGVNFSTFVLSLYSSALVQMGEMADPATGERYKNLEVARQTVDMIIMLEEKTRGNLDADESKLIQNMIHELRMAYVKAK